MAKILFEYDSETNSFKIIAERDVRVFIERTTVSKDSKLTPIEVFNNILEYYKVTKEQLLTRSKKDEFIKVKKVISYYLVEIWNYPSAATCRLLGYNTLSVAKYHSDKVKGYLETGDIEYIQDIKNLNSILRVRT